MSSTAPNHRQAVQRGFIEELDSHRVALSGILQAPPPNADAITFVYPNNLTEVFEYREGGLSGAIVRTVTVIYSNASKDELVSLEVT